MTFGNTLTVDLHATRYGAGWLVVLAMLALGALFFALPPVWFLALAVAVAGYTLYCIRRLYRPRFRRLITHPGSGVSLIPAEASAEPLHGEITGRPFVSPWMVCIAIATPARRYQLCLFADSTGAAAFRRLAARLRGQGT